MYDLQEYMNRPLITSLNASPTTFLFSSHIYSKGSLFHKHKTPGPSHHRNDVTCWGLYLITVLVGLVCYNKRLGGLKNRNVFLTILRLENSKSRCQSIQLLVKNLFLACRLSLLCPYITQSEQSPWGADLVEPENHLHDFV